MAVFDFWTTMKKIDFFGRRVQLFYEKKSKFKTSFGALCSLMMGFILLLLFSLTIIPVINGDTFTISE